jgi:hypothetical protein
MSTSTRRPHRKDRSFAAQIAGTARREIEQIIATRRENIEVRPWRSIGAASGTRPTLHSTPATRADLRRQQDNPVTSAVFNVTAR